MEIGKLGFSPLQIAHSPYIPRILNGNLGTDEITDLKIAEKIMFVTHQSKNLLSQILGTTIHKI